MRHTRFIGVWRRLFAEPAVSPAIERFLGVLSKTPYRWRQAPNGKIRARLEAREICVITGAVRHWTGVSFSVGDWVRAAAAFGLSPTEAGVIVEAADEVRPSALRARVLRQRLLAATGLDVLSTKPASAPDGADRALAGLRVDRRGHRGEPGSTRLATREEALLCWPVSWRLPSWSRSSRTRPAISAPPRSRSA